MIPQRSTVAWWLALLLVPLLTMGLRLWDLNASETWDEVAYFDAAHDYYQNVVAGRWTDAEAWQANREHPAVAKWLYLLPSLDAIRYEVSDYNPGRLLAAFLGSLTVLLTMLLGRRLYSWPVGVVAGLTLALLPTVIGLNRVLGLDTPFTFFFVLTIWAFVEATLSQGTTTTNPSTNRHESTTKDVYSLLTTHYSLPTWLWHLIALTAFGFTLGTRLTGVLLWPILAMIAIISVVSSQQLVDRDRHWSIYYLLSTIYKAFRANSIKPTTYLLATAYLFIPPLIVFATWPWLWHETAQHWQITWGHWSPVATFFLGVLQEPGPGYYAIYFLATFPALFVLLAILWLARAIARGSQSDWILAVWVLGVVAFSAYGLRQGGFRYLLPVVPALAIGVAAYLIELASRMKGKRAIWLLPAIFVGYLVPHAIVHQPYQLDYYNELSGGTAHVAQGKWLQVGWWGEGVQAAVDWLNATAP